jgi:hypothetical protein
MCYIPQSRVKEGEIIIIIMIMVDGSSILAASILRMMGAVASF